MSRCAHRRTTRLRRFAGSWGQACDCQVHADGCDALVCAKCGHWLSLGQANDEDPRVAVEIRAAELADELSTELADELPGIDDDEERRGWVLAATNMQHHTERYQAGYLARMIFGHTTLAEHDKEAG